MTAVDAQHNLAAPGSVPVNVVENQHRPLFRAFLAATMIRSSDTVLDVGMTRDRSDEHSNYFDAWYPHKDRITAAGLDDAFNDGSFDYVHSSAVLENIGDRASQAEFLRQTWRVARRGIFITTPNRWFLLRRLGRDASEQHPNPLSASDLLHLGRAAGIPSGEIWRVSPFLWTTNLALVALRH
jgi:hypothetical protein